MKKVIMILMAVALVALPIMAQQQEWQSTSSMQTSGSTYTPQVTPVGAGAPAPQSPAGVVPGGPKRDGLFPDAPDTKDEKDNTPVGDAVLPLTLMALAYALVVYFRKRKETLKG